MKEITLKFYTFDPQNWGFSYHVLSDSPKNALKAVRKFLKEEAEDRGKYCGNYLSESWKDWLKWKKAAINKLPDDYYIIEHKKDEVFITEAS